MHGKLVDTQIEGGQIELVEDLVEGHWTLDVVVEDDLVAFGLHFLLDESQQVLLIHARGGVNVRVHLAHVVEVAMWHGLLLRDLLELVEHAVQLELGLQVVEASIAECFSVVVIQNRIVNKTHTHMVHFAFHSFLTVVRC